MVVYKTLAKNEYGEYRVIEQEAKSKTAFIRNLRANGYRVAEMKVKTKEIFNRASELIDYISSVEEAETIWKNIKSVDDTVETITERAFGF